MWKLNKVIKCKTTNFHNRQCINYIRLIIIKATKAIPKYFLVCCWFVDIKTQTAGILGCCHFKT